MTLTLSYRLILLGLLPVVAFLIYVEGQQYDPALIRFESVSSSESGLEIFLPVEINGFTRRDQLRLYTKDNLYEYVNGHAEYFLSAGFEKLAVGEYTSEGGDAGSPSVIVDIYDMGSGIQAFGILSDESGGRTDELLSGLNGFTTPSGVSFAKGHYYVRISSFDEKNPLDVLTEYISNRITAESDPFLQFSGIPDLGDVVTTRFIKEAYRGLDFVNNVIEREYSVNGMTFQISIFPGDKRNREVLVDSFINFFQQSDIQYTESPRGEKKVLMIRDPYEGDWVLIAGKDSLFALYGDYNDSIINTLVSEQTL